MKSLNKLNVSTLEFSELIQVNGGTDNCRMKDNKGFGYYLGYAIGWIFD